MEEVTAVSLLIGSAAYPIRRRLLTISWIFLLDSPKRNRTTVFSRVIYSFH
jgi:hypothetical protein